MSFKYRVVEESAGHFVLPRGGEMRTEVHAFLSRPLFDRTDEKLWSQAAAAAAYPGAIGFYLMPDTHVGYGIPVGGVLVTDDTIVQAGSGYDRQPLLLRRRRAARAGPRAPRGVLAAPRRAPGEALLGAPQQRRQLRRRQPPPDRARDPGSDAGSVRRRGGAVLIPGSMLDGAAILFALPGAFRSGYSVNHGSGRHMARGEAKRELAALHDDIDREMATITRTLGGVSITGVVGNTERTPLDECAHVYKSLDEVLAVLEAEGIARVAHRLYPVANIKGTD